ncbi:MAG: PEGA domain-containing protein [Bacillota bacterium]|jgi:hypothetical protein
MATRTRTERAGGPAKAEKKSKPVIGALLVVLLGVAVFYMGAQYYTAKRSTILTCLASGFAEDGITLYRVPSGALDKFAPDDPHSLTVKVPLAHSYRIKDADGKSLKSSAFYVAEGSERAVKVTINPQGKVCRIEEIGGFFSIEGAASVIDKREMDIGGTSYFVDGTLFLSSGRMTGKSGDDLEGSVETGDTVRVIGYGDRALLVDVVRRAGRLSITSVPDGSRVYIDGVQRGKTPLVVTCAPGECQILVRKEGYRDHSATVSVASMKEAKYEASLEQITGSLYVTSVPSGASVYVGDVPKGTTPVKVDLPPGRHQLRFELEGYQPKTQDAIVIAEYEQPVSVSLTKNAGSSMTPPGGSTAEPARDVTVVKSDPSTMTFVGMYPAGYTAVFRITNSTSVDGWPASKSTVERLLPGEEVRVALAPDGSVASMSKTYSHGFTLKDKIQAVNGASVFLGSRWVECSLAWNAVVQDENGETLMRPLSPGDTVTVYGASAGDVRYVRLEDSLGDTWQTEGHLVSTPQGLTVFGDNYIIGMDIPANLPVADPVSRATVSISQIPSGSRVRFYRTLSQETVWAELVWRANVSASGPLSLMAGSLIKVAPLWNELQVADWPVVYQGSSKSHLTNLTVGDTVLAAGPSEMDIRFIWVQDKVQSSNVIEAVVANISGRQEKAFFEITPSGLGTYPYYAASHTTFGYPAGKRTLRASELQPGDRVKLWVDGQRTVIWGEVTEKTDTRATGIYLGVKDGYTYLSGFQRFNTRSDLIITGISDDAAPQPGSKVLVAGVGGMLSYMEIQTDLKPGRSFKGRVLSVDGLLLRVQGSWRTYTEFPFAKDTWFVDWGLMRDGPVSGLFPGDEVEVTANMADEAMFVERTYSPPFKYEGTIKARKGRTLVLTDKSTTRTVELKSNATIYKDGRRASVVELVVGDTVMVSGEDKDHIDFVVTEW